MHQSCAFAYDVKSGRARRRGRDRRRGRERDKEKGREVIKF